MQQRLSIFDLWDVLQRDRFYSDETTVHAMVKELKYEYLKSPFTFDLNYELVGKGYTTIPSLNLIFVLCGLCRLNTYPPSKDEPTGWFGQEFADRCKKLDLEIDRDEFKELLNRLELPLPEAWFPDDTDEPQKKADLDAATMVPNAVTEESSVPLLCSMTLDVYAQWLPRYHKGQVDELDTLHLSAPYVHPEETRESQVFDSKTKLH